MMQNKGFPLIWGPRKRLPFLGHKGSCQCGKIALTDEGFVNLFKDKYNDASHLPLIRHGKPRHLPPRGKAIQTATATK